MSYAEVVVLKKFPRNAGIYDYHIPAYLSSRVTRGSLALVPFRNQMIWSVVITVKNNSLYDDIKEIMEVYPDSHRLSSLFIDSLLSCARLYSVSPSLLFRMAIPAFPIRGRHVYKPELNIFKQRKIPGNSFDLHDVLQWNSCIRFYKYGEYFFQYFRVQQKILFYLSLIKKSLSKNAQIIFFVPEIQDIDFLYSFFDRRWSQYVSFWHGKMNKNQSYFIWQNIVLGHSRIVIGTQSLAFVPFHNAQAVIIDDEHAVSYKQNDRNPRYSTIEVMRMRAKTEKFSLISTSFSPLVTSYIRTKKKQTALIPIRSKTEKMRFLLIDLNNEFSRNEGFNFFPEQTIEQMNISLSNNGRIFVFFHNRGFSRSFHCKNCGHMFQCRSCGNSYALFSDNGRDFLQCKRCHAKIDAPLSCPRCSGVQFVKKGYGIQRLAHILRNIFPNVSLRIIDSGTQSDDDGLPRIVLGTEYSLHRLKWESIRCVVIVRADQPAHASGSWRSTEIWYSVIREICMKAQSHDISPVIFQSFNLSAWWLTPLLKNNYDLFYREELEYRKRFLYPPFSELIRFFCFGRDQKSSFHVQSCVYKELQSRIQNEIDKIFCSTDAQKKSKKYYSYILLKKRSHRALDLSWLPEQCFVDRNPEHLLS